MERGAVNLSQNFGVSAYPGRMTVEVLPCVNNLQSRCDLLEDASAMLGCAACCSGLDSTSDGLLLENTWQPFIGHLHNSQIESSNPFLTSNAVNQQISSNTHEKRLRKRPAGFPEEDTTKKRGRANHFESVVGISGQRQRDKERLKAARPRKGKDTLSAATAEEEKPFSKEPELKVRADERDAETVALEWQQCVSLLKRYGVIENPDLINKEMTLHCVPHPGYVGDGFLAKMCKVCGALEDASNTVICDDCEEAFHLSCCVPRVTSKYFKREDNWFCVSCRKQRRKTGSKLAEKGSSQEDNRPKVTKHNESKARLGPAHQADVPEWQDRAPDDDAERCVEGCIGMEIPFTKEQKDAERDRLLKSFNDKIELLCWLPAEKVPSDMVQNWVKCKNVLVRARKDSDGKKQNDIVCGKWRRAPLNVEQTDDWECFCAMEWDPLHADCSIPQECSDEEVLIRIAHRMQTNTDVPACEAGTRKSTLRQGKLV